MLRIPPFTLCRKSALSTPRPHESREPEPDLSPARRSSVWHRLPMDRTDARRGPEASFCVK